ncbi:aspartic proteinase-like protein 2 [Selaginella moellendorffii]|uniref:aspartic proteinase-like protein 2 n=1 Tax=Selaginella moellendorffii TaxID=88036 RepID=UPI000D1C80AF|nr:aspartic proteinase-like protein 2 [Selaginella moellendorffii]|eukprot:XP_024542817.1 aspartic proteinase-like protein 2 [Selaginella moellendorffii]
MDFAVVLLSLTVLQLLRVDGAAVFQLKHRFFEHHNPASRGISEDHFKRLVEQNMRRGRSLASVEFGLEGGYSEFGLYYTEVELGSPFQKLKVIVDTGSNIFWVKCKPCQSCLNPEDDSSPSQTLFDTNSSSTLAWSRCSDPLCDPHQCQNKSVNSVCSFEIGYGDNSSSSGAFVRDNISLVLRDQGRGDKTSQIFLGCANYISGSWPGDGVMGFGPLPLAAPSQIAAQRNLTKIFSHCLSGERDGGGVLALGESPPELGMVYTPLLNTSGYYSVILLGISVNAKILPIDTKDFLYTRNTSGTHGVIFDSGTTFATLSTAANNLLFQTILNLTSATVASDINETRCFHVRTSLGSSFPNITLFFQGGASMSLTPENYLAPVTTNQKIHVYCYVWQSSGDLTVLGEIVLKDKLVVYDLENSRVGWKKGHRDCHKQ